MYVPIIPAPPAPPPPVPPQIVHRLPVVHHMQPMMHPPIQQHIQESCCIMKNQEQIPTIYSSIFSRSDILLFNPVLNIFPCSFVIGLIAIMSYVFLDLEFVRFKNKRRVDLIKKLLLIIGSLFLLYGLLNHLLLTLAKC